MSYKKVVAVDSADTPGEIHYETVMDFKTRIISKLESSSNEMKEHSRWLIQTLFNIFSFNNTASGWGNFTAQGARLGSALIIRNTHFNSRKIEELISTDDFRKLPLKKVQLFFELIYNNSLPSKNNKLFEDIKTEMKSGGKRLFETKRKSFVFRNVAFNGVKLLFKPDRINQTKKNGRLLFCVYFVAACVCRSDDDFYTVHSFVTDINIPLRDDRPVELSVDGFVEWLEEQLTPSS
ncbi:MAG: hypothetical protein HRT90_10975 [Candidatus Margulisbacteria bacterium]|nr:hypothetical protein [Candidatus Margulisiibacteriota bacterium]